MTLQQLPLLINAICPEIQATWLVGHKDQSAVRKKIRRLHFKLTLRSSDTVHVPVRLIGSNVFSFKKQKQEKPLQFIKEVELLRQTEDRKDLSTSTSTR